MVVGGEPQAVRAGHLGTLPAAAAQNPDLHISAFARDDVCLDAVGRAVAATQQGEDVGDLITVVLRMRARLQQQPLLQLHARRSEQPLGSEPRRDAQAVRRPAVDHLDGAGQGWLLGAS